MSADTMALYTVYCHRQLLKQQKFGKLVCLFFVPLTTFYLLKNYFADENYAVPHNKRGILGMANKGRHSNSSQFYITLQATPYMDRKLVAFG